MAGPRCLGDGRDPGRTATTQGAFPGRAFRLVLYRAMPEPVLNSAQFTLEDGVKFPPAMAPLFRLRV